MVTTELGACEWFVWDLRRSNLLDRGQLDQIVSDFISKNPRAEPAELAEFMVADGHLSKFQADRLLQGKTQGFVLGPFTLVDSIGSGSMGTVYKAQNKTDSKWYAVKVLPRRSMWNVRIARRKVRAFEKCDHPSVVPFVDVGTSGGMHYLAWPYIEGRSLDKFGEQNGMLKPGIVALYGIQIAEGLYTVHQQGLFHGLLKPSNLMINEQHHVSILDLGIGSLLAETEGESLVDTMSTANSVASGLDCASPESIMDPTNLTPSGDQYSLGCVLYFLLTGQYPFPDGSAAEKMMAHQFKDPTPIQQLNPDVPDELVAIVDRLMKKSPDDRFAGADEVVDALKPFAEDAARDMDWAPSPSSSPDPKALPPRSWHESTQQDRLSIQAGPITPTPRPQKRLDSLPSRNSLREEKPQAEPAEAIVTPDTERQIPGAMDHITEKPSWEERMGPLGVTVAAIVACGAVWGAAVALGLF